MKAVTYSEYGSPDVLKLTDVERPIPRKGEVLIKVKAASVNSWDWDLVRGKPFIVRLIGGGIAKPKLQILGADISGVVEALGDEVADFRVGDEVYGDNSGGSWGGFAEYACVPETMLALKSPKMTFEQAASLPQAGVLALQGLRDSAKFKKGDKILINGAGGGVGTFALQMAKSVGAEVTCVDSAEKFDMLSAQGADHLIDYEQEDFTKNGIQYDIILDVVAYHPLRDYLRALGSNGVFVFVGGSLTKALRAFLFTPLRKLVTRKRLNILAHKPNRKDLENLNKLFEDGVIEPVIQNSFQLADTADAVRLIAEGKAQGKVVVTVSSSA